MNLEEIKIDELNKKTELDKRKLFSLKDIEAAFGHIPAIKVEEYDQYVPYADNLEKMTSDYDGRIHSRGIVHVKDGKFLDIKCEYDDEIKTALLSTIEAVQLIIQFKKYELLEDFGLKELASEIASY